MFVYVDIVLNIFIQVKPVLKDYIKITETTKADNRNDITSLLQVI